MKVLSAASGERLRSQEYPHAFIHTIQGSCASVLQEVAVLGNPSINIAEYHATLEKLHSFTAEKGESIVAADRLRSAGVLLYRGEQLPVIRRSKTPFLDLSQIPPYRNLEISAEDHLAQDSISTPTRPLTAAEFLLRMGDTVPETVKQRLVSIHGFSELLLHVSGDAFGERNRTTKLSEFEYPSHVDDFKSEILGNAQRLRKEIEAMIFLAGLQPWREPIPLREISSWMILDLEKASDPSYYTFIRRLQSTFNPRVASAVADLIGK